jgi:lipopolysaccharide transport system ATP-binding protein
MSSVAVKAEQLTKHYSIAHPERPRLRDYVAKPIDSARRPRTLVIPALSDVSFEVGEGQVFGIIGRNGAGKSTLLRILSRITTPTTGRAIIRGRVASLLEVGTGFHPELTGRENVHLNGMLLGMSASEIARAFDAICDFAGIGPYIDTPIKRYSSGMQLRLAFSVAAHLAADTMIVDEVLAVGDAEFQAKCTTAMRAAAGRGRTTLFVSHNLAAIENLCDHVMLLERGAVRAIGSAAEVVGLYLRTLSSGHSERHQFQRVGDSTTSTLYFTSAKVAGDRGGTIAQGDDIVLDLYLRARKPVRALQIMVTLTTAEGHQVAAVSNGDYKSEWDLLPGAHGVRVHLSSVRLLPRAHRISLRAFADWGAEVFDEVPDALEFQVHGRDVLGSGVMPLADRGVTWFPATFQLTGSGEVLDDVG